MSYERNNNFGVGGMQGRYQMHTEQQEEQYLPPVWIDLQEQVDENIDSISQLVEELKPLRTKRFNQ